MLDEAFERDEHILEKRVEIIFELRRQQDFVPGQLGGKFSRVPLGPRYVLHCLTHDGACRPTNRHSANQCSSRTTVAAVTTIRSQGPSPDSEPDMVGPGHAGTGAHDRETVCRRGTMTPKLKTGNSCIMRTPSALTGWPTIPRTLSLEPLWRRTDGVY